MIAAPRTPTRIIRLGRCKLWLRDGETAKLDLTVHDGETWRGRTYNSISAAPKIKGWAPYFVGRYGSRRHTVWSYRRTAS
jgi:hypothetical protein